MINEILDAFETDDCLVEEILLSPNKETAINIILFYFGKKGLLISEEDAKFAYCKEFRNERYSRL